MSHIGILLAFALAPAAIAQLPASPSPVGLWAAVDDNSDKVRAVVRVFEVQGRLYGDIVRVLEPGRAGAVCQKCVGDRKDKPVLGLQIIRGLHPDGDQWDSGTILDPENGDVYRCSMRLADGGRKLVVRGYLGLSLFGRSQTWIRQ